jgi:hypothetical protein
MSWLPPTSHASESYRDHITLDGGVGQLSPRAPARRRRARGRGQRLLRQVSRPPPSYPGAGDSGRGRRERVRARMDGRRRATVARRPGGAPLIRCVSGDLGDHNSHRDACIRLASPSLITSRAWAPIRTRMAVQPTHHQRSGSSGHRTSFRHRWATDWFRCCLQLRCGEQRIRLWRLHGRDGPGRSTGLGSPTKTLVRGR